jgi:hypothetical protein
MYSGQFLEMCSQSVHAQNLADAERKQFTSGAMGDIAYEPTSFTQVLYRQLARLALGRRRSTATRLHSASQVTGLQ